MKITHADLVQFISLTSSCGYTEERKETYRKLGRKILKAVADLIGLKKGEYDIRWNSGGIAVSGDHTLHTDKFYLALHDNLGMDWFYWRTCQGRKDYTGGMNQIYAWTTLSAYGLELLADTLKKVQYSA
jgi:hypothetical protein